MDTITEEVSCIVNEKYHNIVFIDLITKNEQIDIFKNSKFLVSKLR